MFKAVMGLAAVMVTAGGTAIFNGWQMVLNERGWSQVIAGSVILSTGLLIIALAALLAHFKEFLQTRLASASGDGSVNVIPPVHGQAEIPQAATPESQSHFAEVPPTILAGLGAVAGNNHVEQPASGVELHRPDGIAPIEPIKAFADTFETKQEPIDQAYKPSRSRESALERLSHDPIYQEPAYHEPTPHDLLANLAPQPVPMPTPKPDDWAQGSLPPSWQEASLPPSPPVQPSLLDRLAQEIEHPAPATEPPIYQAYTEPRRPIMPPVAPAPAVERELVASYTAGGVGYFMYSDQTIEAEMAIGRYRFGSMDELRHFVETNEGGIKVGESNQI